MTRTSSIWARSVLIALSVLAVVSVSMFAAFGLGGGHAPTSSPARLAATPEATPDEGMSRAAKQNVDAQAQCMADHSVTVTYDDSGLPAFSVPASAGDSAAIMDEARAACTGPFTASVQK